MKHLPLECDWLLDPQRLLGACAPLPIVLLKTYGSLPTVAGERIHVIRQYWNCSWSESLASEFAAHLFPRFASAVESFRKRLGHWSLCHYGHRRVATHQTEATVQSAAALGKPDDLSVLLEPRLRELTRAARMYRTLEGIDGFLQRRMNETSRHPRETAMEVLNQWGWSNRFSTAIQSDLREMGISEERQT